MLAELNRVRTDPRGYEANLLAYRRQFNARIVRTAAANIITEEGVAPVDEAIAFVGAAGPRPPLATSADLALAAADHCADQGDDGAVGHVGRDGSMPGDRVRRRGGGDYVGEVIAYGAVDAADVVRQLIVDDGVRDRGHRALVFADDLRFAGVSCGPHPVYRTVCVIDLARTADGRSLAATSGAGVEMAAR